jgi:hypothetical protein
MSRLMTARSSEELFRAVHAAARSGKDAMGGAPWINPRQVGATRQAGSAGVLVQPVCRSPHQADRQLHVRSGRPTIGGLVGRIGENASADTERRGKGAAQHVGLGHAVAGSACRQRRAQAAQVDADEVAGGDAHETTNEKERSEL